MVGFLGTSTLANFIRNPNDNLPCKKSKISALMDGHFFVIKNIKYDEQNDNVKIGAPLQKRINLKNLKFWTELNCISQIVH